MADSHYIRWRGQVSGPFDQAQVTAMLADGRISRHHQTSTDGTHWQTVDQSGLAAVAPRPALPAGVAPASAPSSALQRITPSGPPQPAARPNPLKVAKARPRGQADVLDWLYVEDDGVMGPISFTVLRGLAESGVLDPDTDVSPDGADDWRPLRDVVPLEPAERLRPAVQHRFSAVPVQLDPLPAANASMVAQHKVSNMAAMVFCRGCGQELHGSARACPHCGATQGGGGGQGKSKVVAGFLALFLGGIGVHRFYLGQWWGLFYLLFCWTFVPGIIAFVEAIVFFCTSDADWQEKYG